VVLNAPMMSTTAWAPRRSANNLAGSEQGGEDYDTDHVLTRDCDCRQDHLAGARLGHEAEQRPAVLGAPDHQIGHAPVQAGKEQRQHDAPVR
jgi:hypothetical protein